MIIPTTRGREGEKEKKRKEKPQGEKRTFQSRSRRRDTLWKIQTSRHTFRGIYHFPPQVADKNNSRTHGAQRVADASSSRDRRSRLASSAPRHPDFFNLHHPPLSTSPHPAATQPWLSRCFQPFYNSPFRLTST